MPDSPTLTYIESGAGGDGRALSIEQGMARGGFTSALNAIMRAQRQAEVMARRQEPERSCCLTRRQLAAITYRRICVESKA